MNPHPQSMSPGLWLGIETSGTATGLALARGGEVLAEMVAHSDCNHNEVLLPLLDQLLQRQGVKVAALSGIGVDVGPGMFTSLRVGLSVAKGLALAHRIPVIGIDSLELLARTAQASLDSVLAVTDARKQQFYAALYLAGQTAMAPAVMDQEELAARVVPRASGVRRLVAAGNAVRVVAEPLLRAGIELELADVEHPSPGVVAVQAGARLAQGSAVPLAETMPLYLRRTDAELTREQRRRSGN